MKHLRPFQVTWVEIRPLSGIVTKRDALKLGVSVHRNGYAYRPFSTLAHARFWVSRQLGIYLTKHYEVRFFSDYQFGKADKNNNYMIPFTQMQERNYVTI